MVHRRDLLDSDDMTAGCESFQLNGTIQQNSVYKIPWKMCHVVFSNKRFTPHSRTRFMHEMVLQKYLSWLFQLIIRSSEKINFTRIAQIVCGNIHMCCMICMHKTYMEIWKCISKKLKFYAGPVTSLSRVCKRYETFLFNIAQKSDQS